MATSIDPSTEKEANPFASWKVDHAALRVPDYDAAIAWYTKKLHFRLRKHVSFAGLTFAFLSPCIRICMPATSPADGITCVFVRTVSMLRSNS